MFTLPQTLKARLTLLFGTLLIGVVAVTMVLVFGRMKRLVLEKHMRSAQSVAHIGAIPLTDAMLSSEMGKSPPEDYFHRTLRTLRSDQDQAIIYAVFVDAAGSSALASSTEGEWFKRMPPSQLGDYIYRSKSEWILQTTASIGISSKVWGYLVLGFDATKVQTEVRYALILISFAGFTVILITLAVVNLMAEQITKRLNRMMVAVDQFSFGESQIDLPEGDDEIGRLATRFNEMRERLIQSSQELRDSERSLFHAEKLASVGRLAAGVAHEINNPLTGIRHAITNILSDASDEKERQEYLTLIDEALKKIESVITKLLGFSRRRGDVTTDASLADAVTNAVQLLDYTIQSKKADVKFENPDGLPALYCDPHLLDEICMNLIINALDAVDENGHIVCRTGEADGMVTLEIEDDGHGISEDVMLHLFEPFFTTKQVGEGTGLGLYVTREIVHGLRGRIDVSSNGTKGAKFTVLLPLGS
ncbi:MAG: ATP-binding protein [Candidatus Marinimicrobia bacterium]|nr:ATP-binding protein [Candidatus Neomarinimicrobiota bacterium]MDP6836097.1 ATP-binding protein [Candidatus Neomarinimicrobiota bacterium]